MSNFIITDDPLYAFEDTIDGYFPLAVSLSQLLERLGSEQAVVELHLAPIMDIPGLPPSAPVPLRISRGRFGQIAHMALFVRRVSNLVSLNGYGDWAWFDTDQTDPTFDPLIRLAEPAYVTGYSFSHPRTACSRAVKEGIAKRVISRPEATSDDTTPLSQPVDLLGPFSDVEIIEKQTNERTNNTHVQKWFVHLLAKGTHLRSTL